MDTQTQMLPFARRHDWGYDAMIVDGGVRVGCEVRHADGIWVREHAVVTSMRELLAWAGY